MATRALLAVISASPNRRFISSSSIRIQSSLSSFSRLNFQRHSRKIHRTAGSYSSDKESSVLPPPDVSRLAETARISLTPGEIEECETKIRRVIDWFGQLQQVDVNSVEPAIRADMDGGNLRDDSPETFENRDSIRASIPSFEEAYLKVPKILNKE
ncbi:PREDICTED: glutamyl-tRNA(Gln) amidotransferase subunit C, chloroplastic/mitochondrial [Camelina sativa]|uniref:Glutamyl-tRNA(Gln) amidotransferase subunit C, chloroplastic/mitochondrial n=1 Tax=Camelina sativa TaxID=90675 RepID=A0ABM0TWW8_CAMSA|nr:PREDICTED: glutamyl-tRNA(Gln) amidotransferase subunit C, chloroplastic/mitochondrial [Camelina sativa]XP_010432639.1 PREDICTED: glutamyl-tRNA(Gln) amidotransferase subunit C, chloroplastic/mitochondrial [Camelina sativa]